MTSKRWRHLTSQVPSLFRDTLQPCGTLAGFLHIVTVLMACLPLFIRNLRQRALVNRRAIVPCNQRTWWEQVRDQCRCWEVAMLLTNACILELSPEPSTFWPRRPTRPLWSQGPLKCGILKSTIWWISHEHRAWADDSICACTSILNANSWVIPSRSYLFPVWRESNHIVTTHESPDIKRWLIRCLAK